MVTHARVIPMLLLVAFGPKPQPQCLLARLRKLVGEFVVNWYVFHPPQNLGIWVKECVGYSIPQLMMGSVLGPRSRFENKVLECWNVCASH